MQTKRKTAAGTTKINKREGVFSTDQALRHPSSNANPCNYRIRCHVSRNSSSLREKTALFLRKGSGAKGGVHHSIFARIRTVRQAFVGVPRFGVIVKHQQQKRFANKKKSIDETPKKKLPRTNSSSVYTSHTPSNATSIETHSATIRQ